MEQARLGDRNAFPDVLEALYADLRRIARAQLQSERPSHTLQPTALVHEALLRLYAQKDRVWESRGHFLAIAARLMRLVLVDHGRRRAAGKRQGFLVETRQRGLPPINIVALDQALHELATLSKRQSDVVELRFFGGLTVAETAQILEISPETVHRDWAVAKAWLFGRLAPLAV